MMCDYKKQKVCMCVGGRSKKNSNRENKMDFLFRKFFELSGEKEKLNCLEIPGERSEPYIIPYYNRARNDFILLCTVFIVIKKREMVWETVHFVNWNISIEINRRAKRGNKKITIIER